MTEVRIPKVGDKVLVRHRTKVNKKGEASLESAKGHLDRVKHVMMDGAVTVGSGDLWLVKRSTESGADWVTSGLEGRDYRG